MSTSTEKNKGGRPRISPDSMQLKITIPKDDLDLMKSLSEYTGTKPAAMVRELINESRPVFKAMLEALEANKNGSNPPAGSLADRMLKSALTGKEPSQSDIFEILEDKKK